MDRQQTRSSHRALYGGRLLSRSCISAGISGRTELSAYFAKLLSRNPDWRWQAVEIFNTEEGFTLKWKATIPVKNTQLITYGLDIVVMRGDKICRNEVYFDRVKWMDLMKSGGL